MKCIIKFCLTYSILRDSMAVHCTSSSVVTQDECECTILIQEQDEGTVSAMPTIVPEISQEHWTIFKTSPAKSIVYYMHLPVIILSTSTVLVCKFSV